MKAARSEHLESIITKKEFWNNGKTTVCILHLQNGFQVVGTSGVVDITKFSEVIGNNLAYADAFNKLWMLEGYVLQTKLYEANK